MEKGTLTILVIVVSLAMLVGMWALRRVNEWLYVPRSIPQGLKLPPGCMGWPLIGDMLTFVKGFKRDPDAYLHKYFLSRYEGHGDGIYKAHLYGSPCIITCSPEMNKFVLGEGSAFLPGWPSVELMGPTCMVVVDGPSHKRMRKLILQALTHPLALRKALSRLKKRFTSILPRWAEEKTISLFPKLKSVAFEDICDSFLSMKRSPLLTTMERCTKGMVGGVRAYPINIPGFSYFSAMQCRRKLDKIMLSIIQERKQDGMKEVVEDFLDVLLNVHDEEGNHLSDVEISENLVSFLLGGHESTSYAIFWTMVYLEKNPQVLSKLRDEHSSLRKKEESVFLDDFKNMPFTNSVLNEVLRLVNIAPFVFRTIAQDDVHYKGYVFPKGWKVIAWLRASHMSPASFTDPQIFNPERFQDSTPRVGHYLPFGYGPRLCPGNMLALLSSRIFLHTLVSNYKWKFLDPEAKVTYLPHPMLAYGGKVIFEHI